MTPYSVVMLGGTGQVGAAVVKALMASSQCRDIIMINRRAVANTFGVCVRLVEMDTASSGFEQQVASIVQGITDRPVYGVCCVGIGSGSLRWSEEDIIKLEVGVVGAFARGCKAGGVTRFGLLSAAGASSSSFIRYARLMGRKEETVRTLDFAQLSIFRPGIIAGNVHTPSYIVALGHFLPGRGGTIEQDDIGRAFVRAFENRECAGTAILHNVDMRAG